MDKPGIVGWVLAPTRWAKKHMVPWGPCHPIGIVVGCRGGSEATATIVNVYYDNPAIYVCTTTIT